MMELYMYTCICRYFGTLMMTMWRKEFGSAEKMLAVMNRSELMKVCSTWSTVEYSEHLSRTQCVMG